jgi:hypothetical protein
VVPHVRQGTGARELGSGTIWFFLDISVRKRRGRRYARRSRASASSPNEDPLRVARVARVRTPLATILSSVELLEDFGASLPMASGASSSRIIKASIGRITACSTRCAHRPREADKLEFRPELHEPAELAASIAREIEQAHGRPNRIRFDRGRRWTSRMLDSKLSRTRFATCSPTRSSIRRRVRGRLRDGSDPPRSRSSSRTRASAFRKRTSRASSKASTRPQRRQRRGHGLGLAIVKQCVELHGGTVDFESAPARARPSSSACRCIGHAMSARAVLIVDDDANLLKLLALRLEKEGFDVVEAASGEQALARLAEQSRTSSSPTCAWAAWTASRSSRRSTGAIRRFP